MIMIMVMIIIITIIIIIIFISIYVGSFSGALRKSQKLWYGLKMKLQIKIEAIN